MTKRLFKEVSFLAPYESNPRGLRPAPKEHGGYGVVASGYISGPFFIYENAEAFVGTLFGGRVVRWVDFVRESTQQRRFAEALASRTTPFVLLIDAYSARVALNPSTR